MNTIKSYGVNRHWPCILGLPVRGEG